MRVTVVPVQELDAKTIETWSAIQKSEGQFDSPFFRPEYARAVSSVTGNVKVGIVEVDGAVVGFFPFQEVGRGVAVSVGANLCDFNALIIRSGIEWNARDLLKGCGLKAWQFDHVLTSQGQWQAYQWNVAESPVVDLSGGFERYEKAKRG